jgi:hypothetical protein
MTGKLGQGIFLEDFQREPHALALQYLAAVRRGNAGAFLPPVLEGKKAEKGHPGRILMTINGKNPAFMTRVI